MVMIAWIIALAAAGTPRGSFFPPALTEARRICPPIGGRMKPFRQPVIGDTENPWFSGQLRAAREPSLYAMSRARSHAGKDTIRFTWLPSFHHSVIVRIDRSGSSARLIAKQLSGHGGYAPGDIARTVDRPLTSAERRELADLLDREQLFAQTVDPCEMPGLDGAEWLFEDARGNGYRFVKSWSPGQGPARNFGMFMLRLTGWKFANIY
jgi:hypothetical protein